MPWANGKCLIWDFTCSHTLAPSFLNRAVLGPSNVASDAENRKFSKYSCLLPRFIFVPVAVETIDALGSEAIKFFTDVGRRLRLTTHEARSSQYLLQRLSVAVQLGNAACIVGSVPSTASCDELFYA